MQKSINVAFYAIFAVVSRANIKYILPSIKSGFLSAFTQAFVYCYWTLFRHFMRMYCIF